MAKASIALSWPVRWKCIANGEKVIEQTGPDEIEVDIRDGEMEGASWIEALIRLFAEAERRCASLDVEVPLQGQMFKFRPCQRVVGKKPPNEQGREPHEEMRTRGGSL